MKVKHQVFNTKRLKIVKSIEENIFEQDHKKYFGAKILFLDIETAPILGFVWNLWKQNVGLNQIGTDWYILSWSAKWAHSAKIFYEDQSRKKPGKMEDDKTILKNLWKLLDEADFVVAHNGRKFDLPKINARFILNGMKPPSPYRIIDTLDIAKKNFSFTSNKLEYISEKLAPSNKKLKHKKFPGFELWRECLNGNQEAWDEMKEYNVQDVLALEEVYHKLKGFHQTHPNVGLYEHLDEEVCKVCASKKVVRNGYHYTNVSKFMRWKCLDCGANSRSKNNLLAIEIKRSLLR